MIRTRYAIAAFKVIRDAVDNRVSVIDMMEGMAVEAFPMVLARVSTIWNLYCEAGDASGPIIGRVRVMMNEAVLFETDVTIDFQGARNSRAVLILGGLTIERPGDLKFEWTAPGIETATYHVRIEAVPRAQQDGQPPTVGTSLAI